MKWEDIISKEREKEYYKKLKTFLDKRYKETKVYPDRKNIFNAFRLTPFDKVNVVILGQDPYHQPGQAQGLAFSVPKGFKKPPSLQNILKEIENEFKKPSITVDEDLTLWAKQGVFLLNTILTVENSKPLAHKNIGWTIFTDKIIEELSDNRDNLVFMLWGAQARAKKNLIDKDKHLILESPHPSPLSANRGFFGCNHFLIANEYLRNHNKNEIKW